MLNTFEPLSWHLAIVSMKWPAYMRSAFKRRSCSYLVSTCVSSRRLPEHGRTSLRFASVAGHFMLETFDRD